MTTPIKLCPISGRPCACLTNFCRRIEQILPGAIAEVKDPWHEAKWRKPDA